MKNAFLYTYESELANMTPNKHFNFYKSGLDLKFPPAYCIERTIAMDGQGAFFLNVAESRKFDGLVVVDETFVVVVRPARSSDISFDFIV